MGRRLRLGGLRACSRAPRPAAPHPLLTEDAWCWGWLRARPVTQWQLPPGAAAPVSGWVHSPPFADPALPAQSSPALHRENVAFSTCSSHEAWAHAALALQNANFVFQSCLQGKQRSRNRSQAGGGRAGPAGCAGIQQTGVFFPSPGAPSQLWKNRLHRRDTRREEGGGRRQLQARALATAHAH